MCGFFASSPKPVARCRLQRLDLAERALVEQQVDPLAGGQLALGVLGLGGLLAGTPADLLAEFVQFRDSSPDVRGDLRDVVVDRRLVHNRHLEPLQR